MHVAFDSGSTVTIADSKDARSTCGYVLADINGKEFTCIGLYLGNALTNNECEALGV